MPSSSSNPKPKSSSVNKHLKDMQTNLANSNKQKQTWNEAHKDQNKTNKALSKEKSGDFNKTSSDGKVQGAHSSGSKSKK